MWSIGRTILITGATSGLGLALVDALDGVAGTLLVAGRDEQKVMRTIAARSSSMVGLVGDLAMPGGTTEIEKAIVEYEPDLLVLNAGSNDRKAVCSAWSDDEISRMVALGLSAPIRCARTFCGLRPREEYRRLALILTTSCHTPRAGMSLYVATKCGLMGFGRALQLEAHDLRVHTTLYYPGRSNTSFRSTSQPEYMSAASVGEAIIATMNLPPDLVPHEFTFRPPVDTWE